MKKSLLRIGTFCVASTIFLTLNSCEKENDNTEEINQAVEIAKKEAEQKATEEAEKAKTEALKALEESTKTSIKLNYASLVSTNYSNAYEEALKLQTALKNFTASPSEETHQAAKNAWLAAREPYGQTEAFRFANGPIDGENGPEGALNAWPLDENYVDYVYSAKAHNYVYNGIVNDSKKYSNIDKATLRELNEKGSDKNISIGYHAIEFLLWGQDLNYNRTTHKQDLYILPNGKANAGQRSHTDYIISETPIGKDAERRKQYLNVITEILIEDLKSMVDTWAPNGEYRAKFIALNNNEAIQNILTSTATLSKSELAGERIVVAYNNKDQEDEHSCFSDNTHRDIYLNAKGIDNVLRGTYGNIQGKSVLDFIKEKDATVGEKLDTSLKEAVAGTVALLNKPFDFSISDEMERVKVDASAKKLVKLGDDIIEAGKLFDLTISSELPD